MHPDQVSQSPAMRLRDAERRLEAVLDNATVAIFLMDDRQQCVYMNRAAETLTGYTLQEVQERPLHDVIHHTRPDGSPYRLQDCPIDRAFPEHHQMQGEEIFVHKDGSFYPVAYTASPIRDEASKVVGTIIEVRDIRAEKDAARRQELLINELNHRVKNTLAAVQAIAAQSFRLLKDSSAAQLVFEGRLHALGEAHGLLTEENWLGAELHEIISRTVAPFGERGERFRAEGPQLKLPPKLALVLTMAFHELATNAVKYGALSNAEGRVIIAWTVEPAEGGLRLHLGWTETGGPEVIAPERKGFGTRLIESSIPREFDAEVRLLFPPQGVRFTLETLLPEEQLDLIGGRVAFHR